MACACKEFNWYGVLHYVNIDTKLRNKRKLATSLAQQKDLKAMYIKYRGNSYLYTVSKMAWDRKDCIIQGERTQDTKAFRLFFQTKPPQTILRYFKSLPPYQTLQFLKLQLKIILILFSSIHTYTHTQNYGDRASVEKQSTWLKIKKRSSSTESRKQQKKHFF